LGIDRELSTSAPNGREMHPPKSRATIRAHAPNAEITVTRESVLVLALCGLLALLTVSGVHPYDRLTWLMEVAPIVLALPVLVVTYRRFPLTPLLYGLLAIHAVILMVGGAYTYARVPLGFWMQDLLHLVRNPYDKIGHFAQGFVPALVAREILLRGRYLRRGPMLSFLVLCVVLAISASYELIEWQSAVLLGQGADDFLGTQGDPWDTQSDMAFALLGGASALAMLARLHDQQIRATERPRPPPA
jgi:putative membrane protein